jgi:hypothetical protein
VFGQFFGGGTLPPLWAPPTIRDSSFSSSVRRVSFDRVSFFFMKCLPLWGVWSNRRARFASGSPSHSELSVPTRLVYPPVDVDSLATRWVSFGGQYRGVLLGLGKGRRSEEFFGLNPALRLPGQSWAWLLRQLTPRRVGGSKVPVAPRPARRPRCRTSWSSCVRPPSVPQPDLPDLPGTQVDVSARRHCLHCLAASHKLTKMPDGREVQSVGGVCCCADRVPPTGSSGQSTSRSCGVSGSW